MNIKEVAKAAGVSVATISRVLNHPEQVQPDTKNHILAVMNKLNYQPNWFARGLNLGRTNTIALFVPNIENQRFVNLMTGVETVALKKNHTVFLCNTHANAEEERAYLKMVTDRKVDGIILVSSQLAHSEIASLLGSGCPWVHIGKREADFCSNQCFINYEAGAYQMTRHFIEMGHTSITLLLDSAPLSEIGQLIEGYRRALKELLSHSREQILYAKDTIQGGYLAAQKMLQNDSLPPALIASSNELAFGVMKAANDSHVSIPSEFALAGLSDSPMCSIVTPALTSLELPSRRLGMVAARMLFDLIEDNEESDIPQEIILQPQLKIRHSCGNTKHIYELFG